MFGQGKPDKVEWLKEAQEAYEKVFGPGEKIPEGGRERAQRPRATDVQRDRSGGCHRG